MKCPICEKDKHFLTEMTLITKAEKERSTRWFYGRLVCTECVEKVIVPMDTLYLKEE
jgi:uncharacterized protein YlaI